MDLSYLAFVQINIGWARRHRWKSGDHVTEQRIHSHCFWLVEHGQMHVRWGNAVFSIGAGAACFMPSGHFRDIAAGENGASWLSVGLHADLFGRVDLFHGITSPLVWTPDEPTRNAMAEWMSRLCGEREEITDKDAIPLSRQREAFLDLVGRTTTPRSAASTLISDGLGRALLGLCWEATGGDKRLNALRPMTPPWLPRVLARIASAPETTVRELAVLAGFSDAQFRRTFHNWVGMSPQDYLTRSRLEEARLLLVTTDLLVQLIAERVGFQSLSHFTALFGSHFGTTPARYRANSRLISPEGVGNYERKPQKKERSG